MLETWQRWDLLVHLLGLEAVAGLKETGPQVVVQRGGRLLHLYLLILTPSSQSSFAAPRGKNQPDCQKLAVLTDSCTACSQTGRRANFQLGIGRTLLAELFHGAYGWGRKVGERGRGLQGGAAFSQHGQGIGTLLLWSLQRCRLQRHSPHRVPALAAMLFLCVCFPGTGNTGLQFSGFLEVSKRHL